MNINLKSFIMNITEVKSELGIATLNLNYSLDSNKSKTQWLRHWDNEKRIAVSIHQETVAKIKADPNTNLGIQTETRTGSQGSYIAKRIVSYTPAEVTL